MVNHIVNFFAIFVPKLMNLMVNYFRRVSTKINGHFCRMMFDGLRGGIKFLVVKGF
jgi:hypothetical protein